jgi:hypothetical protein
MEDKKTSLEKRKTEVEKEKGTGRKEKEIGRKEEKEGRTEERKKRKLSSRGNSRDSTPVKRSKFSSLGSSSSPGDASTFLYYFSHVNFKDLFEQLLSFFKIKDKSQINLTGLKMIPS